MLRIKQQAARSADLQRLEAENPEKALVLKRTLLLGSLSPITASGSVNIQLPEGALDLGVGRGGGMEHGGRSRSVSKASASGHSRPNSPQPFPLHSLPNPPPHVPISPAMAVARRDEEKRSRFTSPLKRAAPAPLHAGTHIEPTPPITPSSSRNSSQGQNDPSSSALPSETLSTARKGMLNVKLFSPLSSMLASKRAGGGEDGQEEDKERKGAI
eukprot:scaffold3051_cov167-Ochromonas_danica.AAC.12